MKISTIRILIVLLTMATLNACGGGNDTTNNSSDDNVITFDLIDYIFPIVTTDEETILNYQFVVKAEDDFIHQEWIKTRRWSIDDDGIVTEDRSNVFGSDFDTYEIFSNNISVEFQTYDGINGNDIQINLNRLVKIDEEIINHDTSLEDLTISNVTICTLVEYYSSFILQDEIGGENSYKDVIKMECTSTTDTFLDSDQSEIKYSEIDIESKFYAKNIGLISEYDSDCVVALDNDNYFIDDTAACEFIQITMSTLIITD